LRKAVEVGFFAAFEVLRWVEAAHFGPIFHLEGYA
jgi:hypothetical protein